MGTLVDVGRSQCNYANTEASLLEAAVQKAMTCAHTHHVKAFQVGVLQNTGVTCSGSQKCLQGFKSYSFDFPT